MKTEEKSLEFERGHKRLKPNQNATQSNNRPEKKQNGRPSTSSARSRNGGGRQNRSNDSKPTPGGKSRVERKVDRRPAPRPTGFGAPAKRPKKDVPPIQGEAVRVITLGGVEEVGRNMFAVEYKDNIWVFDVGFQFLTEGDAPGIDYSLPNTEYLEKHRHKIKGIIITHGHLDHIGGIPFLMDRLGNPPIYTRNLTAIMIKKRMHEFPNVKPIKYVVVEPEDVLKIGDLEFYFYQTIQDKNHLHCFFQDKNIIICT